MTALTYLLDHASDIAVVLALLGGVLFPVLSRIASLFGWVSVSKLFDGLGLDVAKSGRALKAIAGKSPTADEIAHAVNAPEDEDTETRLNREDLK